MTPALRLALVVCGLNLVVFTLARAAFAAAFGTTSSTDEFAELAWALYVGFKLDLRLALFISLPMFALALIPALSPTRGAARRFWFVAIALVELLVFALYAVDFGHYEYLRARVNATLAEHLEPLDVALIVLWQSYPVALILFALAVCAFAFTALAARLGFRGVAQPQSRRRTAAIAIVAILFAVAGMWGKLSMYPLRWSDAYFSTDAFISALGLNPILFLVDTYPDRVRGYDRAAVQENYAALADLLEIPPAARSLETLSLARWVEPAAGADSVNRGVNLVVIHLESFAGFSVGSLGNPAGATPRFDALAAEGALFTNFFVPAVPTARSVFTMLTGVPDYEPVQTASRNPLLARQHTLVNALTEHERFYFLGGSASWGNIRGLLTQSIERLRVYEEGDYAAKPADGWGITDHDLFEHAHKVLAATREPFFAFIQTSGNHRPYTIPPDNRRGFETVTRDPADLRAAGFASLAAFNGLRFLDHAIGYYFDLARGTGYFDRTVFVLYGDHGNPSANEIAFERLGLTGFHVPMLVYAPGRLAARRTDTPASLVDLLPSALGLLGKPYLNTTLGRDLFAAPADRRSLALVPHGVLTDELFLRKNPDGALNLYRYRGATPLVDISATEPAAAQELERLHRGLFATARFLTHHNPPRAHRPPQ